MSRRKWTLMLVPEDPADVRQFTLSRSLVQLALGGAILLLATLVSLSTGFFLKQGHELRAERLDRENRLLRVELEEIGGRVIALQNTLEELSSNDEHYRLLAGLEPLDRDVKRAGIGGPGSASPEESELWRVNPRLAGSTFTTASDINALLRRAEVLNSSWNEATRTLHRTHQRLRATPSILPTKGSISSHFSYSRIHPILDVARPHEGIDITAPHGTPIVATASGRVIFVGRHGGYGNLVEIDHGHGVVTRYAHASRILTRKGAEVARGEKIAEVGSTGLSTSPHVHYEVLVDGRAINPRDYILEMDVIPD